MAEPSFEKLLTEAANIHVTEKGRWVEQRMRVIDPQAFDNLGDNSREACVRRGEAFVQALGEYEALFETGTLPK